MRFQQVPIGGTFRRNVASKASSPNDRLVFSSASLGLDKTYITPVLASIRQLPEVQAAWDKFLSAGAIDHLKRAVDVFASFQKGGKEHIAVCALLAECQHRLAYYDQSLHTLHELANTDIAPEDMILAQAKVLWTKGDFEQSQKLCESIISEYDDMQETFPTTSLHMASAMTGKALSQLAAMKTLDDAFSVRDYFRIVIKFLERHSPLENSIPHVAAYSNCGIAEAVYNNFLEETNNVSVPMASALRTWFQGLQKLETDDTHLPVHVSAASKMLQATIHSNLAWGVLNYEKDQSDRLSKASDYARRALAVHDANDSSLRNEGMRRVLSIVASCYQEAGSAVTAEGLFQSAIDRKMLPPGTKPLLELRDAYQLYANLCKHWDKREGDTKRLEKEALEIDESLPTPWRGKSGIHASLWFWTPADFL